MISRDKVFKAINNLKSHTNTSIIEQQKRCLPVFNTGKIFNTDRYHYHDRWYSYKYSADTPNSNFSIIYVENMPYKSLFKRGSHGSFIARMDRMIYDNEIEPFLLFINNRFIKWEDIDIIHDYDDTYFRIHDGKYNYFNIKKLDMLIIPFNISYVSMESDYNFEMYFKATHKYIQESAFIDPKGKLRIRIPIINTEYKYDGVDLNIGAWYYDQLRSNYLKILSKERFARLRSIPINKEVLDDRGNVIKVFNTTLNLFDRDSSEPSVLESVCNVSVDTYIENAIFRFDENGMLTNDGTTVISFIDNNQINYYSYNSIENTINGIENEITNTLYSDNFILFKNGMLCKDGYNIEFQCCNTYKISGIENTTDYNEDGSTYKSDDNNNISYKIFVDNTVSEPINNNSTFLNRPYLNNLAHEFISKGTDPGYLTNCKEELEFKYDDMKTFEDNYSDSLNEVISYNPSLLNDIYDTSIKSVCISGKQFNSSLDVKYGTDTRHGLKVPRMKYEDKETYAMVFINGILLESYNDMLVFPDHQYFPINNICDDSDTVEILYFINCNNNELSFKYDSSIKCRLFDNIINKDELKLFSTDVKDLLIYDDMKYDEDEISFGVYKKDVKGNVIVSDPEKLNGKIITAVSSNKFIYERLFIDKKSYKIRIGKRFRYCDNQKQYALFINGRRILDSYFLISIPKVSRPFNAMYIYLTKFAKPTDRIELFYLPLELSNVNLSNNNTTTLQIPLINSNTHLLRNGYIKTKKTLLDIPYDSKYYLVFINGKKIPSNQLISVNSNTMRLTTDPKATNDLIINCVASNYLKEVADDLHSDNKSKLDIIIDKILGDSELGYDELDKLLGYYAKTSNTEENFMKHNVGKIAIVNEIVRDFWVTSGHDYQANPFVYDYYDETFKEKDDYGNIIIPALDANRSINITKYDLHHLYFCFTDDMPGYYEYGTVIKNPTFTWEYNDNYDTEELEYQKFNDVSLEPTVREYLLEDSISKDTTYILEAFDGYDICKSELDIKFANGLYYGLVDEDAIDGNKSDIISEHPENIFNKKYVDFVIEVNKSVQPTVNLDIKDYKIGNTNYFIIVIPKRLALDKNGNDKITFFCPDITTDEFKESNKDEHVTPIFTNGKLDKFNNFIELEQFKMERFIGKFGGVFNFTNDAGFTEEYVIYKSNGYFTRLFDDTKFSIYVR